MKKLNLRLCLVAAITAAGLQAQVPKSISQENREDLLDNDLSMEAAFSEASTFSIWVNNKKIKREELLSMYLQYNSVSGQEKEAGEWLKTVCHENGLHITNMGDKNGNFNFAASILPLSSRLPNIIFLNHIDVVHQGEDASWIYPPFSGMITEDEVWGRGAIDNKGVAIMQLTSILQAKGSLELETMPFNVTFLAVSCEENQCDGGAKYVVENYLDELNPLVVIGEGSTELSQLIDMQIEGPVFGIALANKRALWLQLDLEVESSGHGSVSPLTYANKEMVAALNRVVSRKQKAVYTDLNIRMLKDLGNLLGGTEGFVIGHPRLFRMLVVPSLRKEPVMFSLFSNTITLTDIDSENETVNTIPSSVTALLDCRLLPNESTEEFLDHLRSRLRNEHINISILKETPPVIAANNTLIFYECFSQALSNNFQNPMVIPLCLPNINDVSYFQSNGVPAYSIIPVCLTKAHVESIHCTNERIPIKCLKQGQETYYSFIEECMNRSDEILNESHANSILFAKQ